jgi:hypothetical protein
MTMDAELPTTRAEAKAQGYLLVGAFGLPGHENSEIWASSVDAAAVRAAYDQIDENNLRLDSIEDVLEAGGVWVADL